MATFTAVLVQVQSRAPSSNGLGRPSKNGRAGVAGAHQLYKEVNEKICKGCADFQFDYII